MSKLLKSDWSRAATAASPSAPGVASTMLALGATRWAALGLRVAAVGLLSAGATALDAYNGAPQSSASPPAIVAPAAVDTASATLTPPVALVDEHAREGAPAVEQVAAPPVLERTASRSSTPSPRAEKDRKGAPEANTEPARQGRDAVIELIRRGHCMGKQCRGSADGDDAPR